MAVVHLCEAFLHWKTSTLAFLVWRAEEAAIISRNLNSLENLTCFYVASKDRFESGLQPERGHQQVPGICFKQFIQKKALFCPMKMTFSLCFVPSYWNESARVTCEFGHSTAGSAIIASLSTDDSDRLDRRIFTQPGWVAAIWIEPRGTLLLCRKTDLWLNLGPGSYPGFAAWSVQLVSTSGLIADWCVLAAREPTVGNSHHWEGEFRVPGTWKPSLMYNA